MKKILIIDDEIHIVELLKFNLENNGYKVDYSYDGFDGYLKTKEFEPDLILLDWMLPNISGIDLLKKIRSDAALEQIPVIMLTAKNMEEDKSYTVARVINNKNCVELHYTDGIATIEYGTKQDDNSWESIIEEILWFDKNQSKDEIISKLEELFEEEYLEHTKHKENNEPQTNNSNFKISSFSFELYLYLLSTELILARTSFTLNGFVI